MNEGIKKALIDIVGSDHYTNSLIDLVSYSYDASHFNSRPFCGIWPQTTEQISEILKLANREKIPVIPRGAGTGLAGMAVPIKGGIVLDMNRMDKIKNISIEDRLAIVEPGVVYATLEKALAKYGFLFPPDPASGTVSTLGGNVATNAGGVRGAKYGTTRDYVLGLQVVLPDGRIMRTGSMTMKSVSGYDLTKIFVGSEGTLGVVTEITLKINPKTSSATTALATFNNLEDAGNAICQSMYSGIIPSVLEILGRETIIAINQNTDLDLPEVDAILLAETDGYTKEETDFQMKKLIEVFEKNKAGQVKLAQSKEEAANLWVARKSSYAVLARLKPTLIIEDVTVPMSKITDLLKGIKAISEKYDIMIATYGHAGDGNLHPQFMFNGNDPDQVKRQEAADADIFKLAIDLGGTLTGEHGIGLQKAPYMSWEHDEVALDVMRSFKKMLDPNNILNPGKMALED